MNDGAVERIADTDTACLGIMDNIRSFPGISELIKISMADTCSCFNDRNPCILAYEMNKTAAPSILLEDFNYLLNKAIYQYINKKYNIYDVNQQSTDDIRVLKSTAILQPTLATNT